MSKLISHKTIAFFFIIKVEAGQYEQVFGGVALERSRQYVSMVAVLFQLFQCLEFDVYAVVQFACPGIERDR